MPRAPGGGSDNIARLLQPGLEKKLGVPIIIDNRPDATAVLGATLVTKARPDGYTFYLADNSFYQNPAILDSLPYDTLKDFTAVTMMAQGPVILIVHPDVPAKTLPELIALAKKTDLTYASGGVGASTHLVGVMLNLVAGTKILHVPFKGSGPALLALLGGHVSMQFGGLSSAAPYIKDGKVRAIAVASDHRDPDPARRADLPGRRRERRRCRQRLGPACPAGHADRAQAHRARRRGRGHARSGDDREAHAVGLRSHRQHAGRAPGADHGAGHPVDRGRQEGEPEGIGLRLSEYAPSTGSATPEMKPAGSESRNSTAAATSSPVPGRPPG